MNDTNVQVLLALSKQPGTAADVKPQTAEFPPQTTPQIPPPQYDPRLDAEKDENYSLLGVLADIRAAVGDREGRLMQDELVERVRAVAKAGAVANADLDKIRDVLGQRIHIGNPPHYAAPVKCAEMAASLIDNLLATNQENHNLIAIASEKLAEVVTGDIDTSDMEVHWLADQVVAQLSAKDDELLEQSRTVMRLRDELANEKALVAKLEHLLQSARNEAEHLRKHAPAPDTTTMDTVPLDALLDAVRAFVPSSALVTVPGHPGTVNIAAFGNKFHVQAKEAIDVLDHIRALDEYLDIPF